MATLDFPGLLGDGVILAYEASSPGYWHRLAPLMDLPETPAAEADELENTRHGSGGYHTKTAGLMTVPNIPFKLLFNASDEDHLALITLQAARTVTRFRVEVPADDATPTLYLSWEGDFVVKKAKPTTGIAELQLLDCELMFNGDLEVTTTPAVSEIVASPA